MTEAEELELLELENENTAQTIDNGGRAGGMGDVKMAESPAAQSYQDPSYGFGQANPAAALVPQFAGDVGKSLSTGLFNSAAQGVQDNWGHPLDAVGGIIKDEAKNLATPFHTFETPIQSSSESLQRMGVPNTPMAPPQSLGSYIPGYGSTYPGGDAPIMGLADQLGITADIMTPIPEVGALKVMGAASRAKLAQFAESTGKAIQDVGGVGQMNRVISPLMRHERQAKNPIAETIFQNKWDLSDPANNFSKGASPSQMHDRAVADMKKWGQQLEKQIAAGKDAGATVDINPIVDAAVARFKAKAGKSPEFYAGIKDIDQVAEEFKNTAATARPDGGAHDLVQTQGFKQYMGNEGAWQHIAKKKGIPLKADETTRSMLAEEIYHDLTDVIDKSTPGGIKNINKKYSDAIAASQALGWRKLIESRGKALSLSDVVLGAEAIVHPSVIPLAIVNKASKSGTVASWMYRLGEKMRAAQTPEEAARLLAAMKTKGMTEAQIGEAMGEIQGMPVGPQDPYSGYQGDFPSWKVKPPAAEPVPFDPMEGMYPGSVQEPAQGIPGIEGMISPEDQAAKAQQAWETQQALARQDRPVRVPQAQEQPGGVQVLSPTEVGLRPRTPKRAVQPNGFPSNLESPAVAKVLNESGRRPIVPNQARIDRLMDALKRAKTKESREKLQALLREENYRFKKGSK